MKIGIKIINVIVVNKKIFLIFIFLLKKNEINKNKDIKQPNSKWVYKELN